MSCPQGDSKKAAAEKELAKTSIFGWGRQQKHEDAAELYKAAANSYKLSDFYAESAECYMLSADNYKIADGNINTDYLNMIIEAANCYKRIDVTKAIQTFAIAIQAYKDTARLSQAGRYQKEVAEILEADHNAIAATSAWDMAADLFSKDNKKSQAKECYLKVAVLVSTAACSSAANNDPESKSSTSSGFTRAADIFEQTGKDCLDSKLGSYSAKSHFFQCLLCTLALGM